MMVFGRGKAKFSEKLRNKGGLTGENGGTIIKMFHTVRRRTQVLREAGCDSPTAATTVMADESADATGDCPEGAFFG